MLSYGSDHRTGQVADLEEEKMSSLYEKLIQHKKRGLIPMHMPGGKGRSITGAFPDAFSVDITEIDGMDDLHHPGGIIKDEMRRCADIYGADESFFLVNGSSSGILAALCGATEYGDKVLLPVNVHLSVINALTLRGLKPVYMYPEKSDGGIFKAVTVDAVREKLQEDPEIRAVFITSPTYEGVVSDIKAISKITEMKNIPLIVDEAHGAHFPFSNTFPDNACRLGADAVVNSTHKTLPTLTQTGLLHLNSDIINKERVKAFWNMLQTTSPSYVLMGSISAAFDYLTSMKGKEDLKEYIDSLISLRERLKTKLKNLELFESDDISKIVILTGDGRKLYDALLEKFHIQPEMAAEGYVILMTSVSDPKKDLECLYSALVRLDESFKKASDSEVKPMPSKMKISPAEAFEIRYSGGSEPVDLQMAEGRTAAETVYIYPPGTPRIVAGEIYSSQIIRDIYQAKDKGYEVYGTYDSNRGSYVNVLKD